MVSQLQLEDLLKCYEQVGELVAKLTAAKRELQDAEQGFCAFSNPGVYLYTDVVGTPWIINHDVQTFENTAETRAIVTITQPTTIPPPFTPQAENTNQDDEEIHF